MRDEHLIRASRHSHIPFRTDEHANNIEDEEKKRASNLIKNMKLKWKHRHWHSKQTILGMFKDKVLHWDCSKTKMEWKVHWILACLAFFWWGCGMLLLAMHSSVECYDNFMENAARINLGNLNNFFFWILNSFMMSFGWFYGCWIKFSVVLIFPNEKVWRRSRVCIKKRSMLFLKTKKCYWTFKAINMHGNT